MNNAQAKRPKAGHAAKPPPRRDIIAYANAVYGYPKTDDLPQLKP